MPTQPVFTFAAIADPQYANQDDAFIEGRNQRYREVPGKLDAAVRAINARGGVAFTLALGDIVDGSLAEDLQTLAVLFDQLAMPVHHVVGNHDLAVTRAHFLKELKIPSSFYSSAVAPGWRLIVADTTDMCPGSGYSEDSPQMQETRAFQASHPRDQYPNMEDWNGGVAAAQQEWLSAELAAAAQRGERVIVASHHAIGDGACRPTHRAWNAPALEEMLTAPGSPVVLALAGHDHPGGYACIKGVHFITLEAMLEAPKDSNAYALLHVHEDEIRVEGFGTATSRDLPLRPRAC